MQTLFQAIEHECKDAARQESAIALPFDQCVVGTLSLCKAWPAASAFWGAHSPPGPAATAGNRSHSILKQVQPGRAQRCGQRGAEWLSAQQIAK